MRDDDQNSSVFKDSDEYEYYHQMFTNLTQIMADIGFSEEASVYMIMIVISILCHTYYQ
jgi:hypothetical protein